MQTVNPSSPEERYDALLLSLELANRLVGKRMPGEVTYTESEQSNARRRLLHVEKLAKKQKLNSAQAKAAVVEKASDVLHDAVQLAIKETLQNGQTLYQSVLSMPEVVSELLDTLATKACSVSKLERLLLDFSWLQDEIIRIVNSPEHRRLDARGKAIVVESIRTALGSLGIENLRKIIPLLVLKSTLPQITDPFPQIKTRLAEVGIGTANTCAKLAELRGMSVYNAYLLGLFSVIGISATWRVFFKNYAAQHQEAISTALNKRDQPTHTALQLVDPSPARLTEIRQLYAKEATTRVFEYMLFKRLNVLTPWTDETHPLAKVLTDAQGYTQLKMLARNRLVQKDEVKATLVALRLPKEELEALNKVDIFALQVQKSSG